MSRTWFSRISLLLVASLLLAACGATPEPTPAPTDIPISQPTATTAPTAPPAAGEFKSVVVAGTLQTKLGCAADWDPACDKTALAYDAASKTYKGSFTLPAGSYEWTITVNGTWDVSFGVDGKSGMGTNYATSLAQDAPVAFVFDPATKLTTVESAGIGEAPAVEFKSVVVAGTLQTKLGCAADWDPACDKTALAYDAASKTYKGTFTLPAGAYDYTITVNGTWDVSFGVGGKSGMGTNYSMNLTKDAPVTLTFDPATKLTTAESEGLTPPPAAAKKGELVIWADMLVGPTLKELAADFSKEYNIPVTVEYMGYGVVIDTFLVAGPAGQGPDIIVATHDRLGELVASGLLTPVDLGDKAAEFNPAAVEALTLGSELYGLPIAVDNVALVRNTDLVPNAPKTWDEVVAVSRQIAAKNTGNLETDKYGFVLHQGDGYHFFPIQTAFGGYIFGKNADGSWNTQDVGLDGKGSLAAAEWFGSYLKEGLQPRGVDPTAIADWFEAGRFGLWITGAWNLARLRESGIPFAVSDLPKGELDATPFLGVQGFMVSAFSQEPLLAQVFLTEFVATLDTFQGLFDGEQRVYAYTPLMESIDDAELAAIAHAGLRGVGTPAIPQMGAVWEAWNNALKLIDQGADTPQNAFANAANQIRTAIGEK